MTKLVGLGEGSTVTLVVDEATATAIGKAMVYMVEDGDAWEHRVITDVKLDAAARRFYDTALLMVATGTKTLDLRPFDYDVIPSDMTPGPCRSCGLFLYFFDPDDYTGERRGWYDENLAPHGCEGDHQWTPTRWSVSYEIRSEMGPGVVHEGTTTVEAPNRDAAAEAAIEWVHDNDSYADERIHPTVDIVDIEMEDE